VTATLSPAGGPAGDTPGGTRPTREPWADRIDAATPAGRDRTVDAARAVAIVGVVLGHWLVTALVADPVGGGVRAHSPLAHWPAAAPVSWLFETLGLFFFAGGYANARSLRGAGARRGYPQWMAGRLGRLLRPALVLVVAWLPVMGLLQLIGAPAETVHAVRAVATDPLWFLGIYLALAALTPVALRAVRRYGPAVAAVPLIVVVATDLARPGPFPLAVELADTLAGWLVPYLLGIALAAGHLTGDRAPTGRTGDGAAAGRRAGAVLLVAGVAGGAGLVLVGGYPASAVGVPGEGWSNLDPPSLFAVALAVAQIGLFLVLRPALARVLRRPWCWAPVAGLNLVAMTVYCWHQSALLLVSLGGLVAGSAVGTDAGALLRQVPGLTGSPADPGWLGWRLLWLPVIATVLCGLCALLQRYERPRRLTR
jgi:hypothetical protein